MSTFERVWLTGFVLMLGVFMADIVWSVWPEPARAPSRLDVGLLFAILAWGACGALVMLWAPVR